jgi:WD40 repeat protein
MTDLLTGTFGYECADGFGLGLTASRFRERLRGLCHGLAPDDLLVLYHTGHADLAGAQHRLWMADSLDRYTNTVPSDELAALILADTPLRQALVVLDTCHAGHGGAEALVAGMKALADPAGTGEEGKSLSLVAAAHVREQILPGDFAELFGRAVAHPGTAGHEPPYLPPAALVAAMNADNTRKKWQTVSHSALFQTGDHVSPYFPNPRYDQRLHGLDLATQLRVEQREHYDRAVHGHFLPRARGTDVPGEQTWRFVGRHAALEELTGWLTAVRDGTGGSALRVVTGDPGSGKSAVLARLVLLADKERRGSVPRAELPAATVPPAGSIDVTVHARGLTHEQVLNALASHTGGPAPSAGRLAARIGTDRMVAVVDALDEALDPETVIDRVIRPLAESGCGLRLLVGTRSHLLDPLGPAADVLNLDDPVYADPASLRAYVERCLRETHTESPYPAADPADVAAVADAVAAAAGRSFLVALIVSRTLASRPALPPDPRDPEWRAGLPKTAAEAMRQDLDIRLGSRAQQARDLLTPLAFALGAGLPWEDIWAPLAGRVTGRSYTDDDLIELRRTAGSYIVEDRHQGHSVYRLYHEALAEALREDWTPAAVHQAFTAFLRGHTPALSPDGVDWSRAHPYVVFHLAGHAARSGTTDLDDLLLDPLFLLAAAPAAVLAEAPAAQGAEAVLAAAAYQRAANRLQGCPPGEALSYLGHAAHRLGATALADRTDRTPYARSWRTVWAESQPETPHRVLEHVEPVWHVACVLPGRSRPVAVAVGTQGAMLGWDLASGRRIGPVARSNLPHAGVAGAGVLPDGHPFALIAGDDRWLRAYDLTTGDAVSRHMGSHVDRITAVAAPTTAGSDAVVVSATSEGWVYLWDVRTGRLLNRRAEHAGPVHAAAVVDLPEGGRVGLTAGLDRYIRVWDLKAGECVDQLGDHTAQIVSLAVTRDADGLPLVFAATRSGGVSVWDLVGRRRVRALGGTVLDLHVGIPKGSWPSLAALTLPDRQPALLYAGTDDTVRLSRLVPSRRPEGDTGIQTLRGHVGTATSVAAARLADGATVAVSGGTDRAVRVWNLQGQTPTPVARRWSPTPGSVEALADVRGPLRGNAVFVAGADSRQLRDVSTGELLDVPGTVAAGFLRGGEVIMVQQAAGTEVDQCVILVEGAVGREVWRGQVADFRGGDGGVAGRVLPGDQPLVAFTTRRGTLGLWTAGAPLPSYRRGRGLRLLGLAEDAEEGTLQLVGAGRRTAAYAWTVSQEHTDRPLSIKGPRRLRGHRGGVTALHCATLAGLGPLAVTGSARGDARVWDLATGRRLGPVLHVHDGAVRAVAVFRPGPHADPLVATAGDGSLLTLWRLPGVAGPAGGEPLTVNLEYDVNCLLPVDHTLLVGTTDGVAALAFAPGGLA